jgi:hypothetical protein
MNYSERVGGFTEQDESVLHEVGVAQQRSEESFHPVSSGCDRGVVAIICHIGSDKHPLREFVTGQILVEHGKVLDLCQTICITRHGVIAYEWAFTFISRRSVNPRGRDSLMLSHIIISPRLLIYIISLEPTIR